MQITNVEAFYVRVGQIKARSDSSQDALLVKVSTDEGLYGWGEVDGSPYVSKAIIEAPPSHKWATGLRSALIGENPLDTERLWRKMHAASLYYGREGAVIQSMAGIDIALWDIKGKALNQPVWRLLGGANRDRVRAYASCLFCSTPEETADRARQAVEAGYSAVKFGWEPFGGNLKSDLALLAAIRDVIGPERDLMLDVGFAWDARTTIQRERAFRDFHLRWIEEPLHPDYLEAYGKVCAQSQTHIAAGEEECTLRGHRRLIEEGGIDIVQIDVTRCGLTQGIKIAQLAQERGLQCVNHNFTTDINTAASLHFLSAVPNAHILERCFEPSALARDLLKKPLQLVAGDMLVPQSPGLGVEPDSAAIERYLVA
jgi:L-rhamnonate dehydratase